MKKTDYEWFIFHKLIEDEWVDIKMTPIRGADRAQQELEEWKRQNPGIVANLQKVKPPRGKPPRTGPPKYKT